jgi:HTH-type transcriptional regulator/antitoxin HigA
MSDSREFSPDWASPPGATVAKLLAAQGISAKDFAEQLGLGVSRLRDFIEGRVPLSSQMAKVLARRLGASPGFWERRESEYRDALSSARTSIVDVEDRKSWVGTLPVKDMIDFGWIKKSTNSSGTFAACLSFFGVDNVAAWEARYKSVLEYTAYRKSPTFHARPASVVAWLRHGEIVASSVKCAPWDRQRFETHLLSLRQLTRTRTPITFLPELRRLCSDCGVAVVVARTPSGCPISGATRFVLPNKAILQLSFRYLSDDHFWFTFFHEAGHLLLHGKDETFLEDGHRTTRKELEANDFAAHALIPTRNWSEMETLNLEKHAIRAFALKIGVSPGIVVGQLQHLGRLENDQLNHLKARYDWNAIEQG